MDCVVRWGRVPLHGLRVHGRDLEKSGEWMKCLGLTSGCMIAKSLETGSWKRWIGLTRSEKPSGSYSSAIETVERRSEYGVIGSRYGD